MIFRLLLPVTLIFNVLPASGQNFYFGSDLSYVNQMEDCGVGYKEQGQTRDVFQIFSDHGCNLIRVRLWHTPAWHDTLNAGKRYSDFQDVRKTIQRAKALGLNVLLDFHLSDVWADPGHQIVPAAWLAQVDNLPVLQDSLYQYISRTLLALDNEDLLPEMVQIGNETNRGILLSPAVNAAGWSLDWNRNSALFKRAIQAVRDVSTATVKPIKVVLHIAGPANAGWLMTGFWNNGVTDFDIIGLSYYWNWHKPTTISDAGQVITQLRQTYPGKEVMIVETGYPWTFQWEDNASNILNEINPAYAPVSPENQQKWLIDLTQEVINRQGKGVVYWEPAWQSSGCWIPWGQGSNLENATFFDFQDNLMENGGIGFMTHDYENLLPAAEPERNLYKVWLESATQQLRLQLSDYVPRYPLLVHLYDSLGNLVASERYEAGSGTEFGFPIPLLPKGVYFCELYDGEALLGTQGLMLGN